MTRLLYVLIAALLLAVAPLPYGIHILIHTFAASVFGYVCYRLFQEKDNNVAYVFLVLTIIYQPLVRITFGRIGWMIINAIVALSLLAMLHWQHFISPDTALAKAIKRFHATFGIN